MVWHAYADDSGTHDQADYCLLLGYIGSPAQWKRFRREWRRVLGDIPEFHSKEFFQKASWQYPKSPYYGWSDSQGRTFLNALLNIINECDIWPIGGACKTADFYSYSKEDRSWLTGATYLTMTRVHEGELEVNEKLLTHQGSPERPYFTVYRGLFVDAMNYTEGKAKPKIHFYLDRQGDAEAQALEAFDLFKEHVSGLAVDNLASVNYRDSEDEVGIQAADLYAYTRYRKLTKNMTPDLERAFRVLTLKKDDIRIIDKETYFDPLLAKGIENRQNAIKRGRDQLS